MIRHDSDRLRLFTQPRLGHARAGLAQVCEALNDRAPNRVWANFQFEGDEGAFRHVDAVVATAAGVFLVVFHGADGRLSGDRAQWRVEPPGGRAVSRPNPAPAARRLAEEFAVFLAYTGAEVGWPPITPLVLLVGEVDLHIRKADRPLCVTGDELAEALGIGRFPGSSSVQVGAPSDALVDTLRTHLEDALDSKVLRPARDHDLVGDYELDAEILFEDRASQDRLARHATRKEVVRFRLFPAGARLSEVEKARLERAARRELEIAQSVGEHPNVVAPRQLLLSSLGPGVVYAHDPDAVLFGEFLADRAIALLPEARLRLVQQLVDVTRYLHRKQVIHRALSPQTIWVRDPDGAPRLQVFRWGTGLSAQGTSRGTSHVSPLLADAAHLYVAPEAAYGLDAKEAADVFSLGMLVARLFAERPFELLPTQRAIIEDGGLKLARYAEAAPRSLRDLVYAATRADARARLQSVDAFAEHLERVAEAFRAGELDTADPRTAEANDSLDDYVVKRRLGAGSTAVALLVADAQGAERVLKVPRTDGDVARVQREAEALAALQAIPNVVRSYGMLDVAGLPCLMLDPAGPRTLRDALNKAELHEELAENLGADLIEVVAAVARAGYPHRDVKPENLGLRATGKRTEVVLFDFSLAGTPDSECGVGTVAYSDPFLGRDPDRPSWSIEADLFSVAIILFEMVAGRRPEWAGGQAAPHTTDDVLPAIKPELFAEGVRDRMAAFFQRALHRKLAQRFPDAEAMLEAWRGAFEVTHHPGEAPASANASTSVTDIGLSPRALDALQALGVRTVGELIAYSERELRFTPGLGARTRRELVEAQARWVNDAPEPAAPVQPLLEELVDLLARENDTEEARDTRALYLGMRPIEGVPEGSWPSTKAVADHRQTTGANISILLGRDRARWTKVEAIGPLREDLVRLVEDRGGVVTPRDLAADLLLVWRSEIAEGAPVRRLAGAAARVGVEVELASDTPRLQTSRVGDELVVVTDRARVEWARGLGTAADRLVRHDALPGKRQVAEALARAAGDDHDLTPGQLRRLAVVFAKRAVLSAWDELYPRGLDAERALGLARRTLLSGEALGVEELRAGLRERFPHAQPLPERPQLDGLLARLGVPLAWDAASGTYRQPQRSVVAPTGQSTRLARADQSTRQTQSQRVREVRESDPRLDRFENVLRDARQVGAWQVFTVAGTRLRACRDLLEARAQPTVVSLDARLIHHMRALVDQHDDVAWSTVLELDDEPDQRGDVRLYVIEPALEALFDELVALDARLLLLHELGLLARYGGMGFLTRLREAIDARRARAQAAWILIPSRPTPGALVDGRPVPIVTPAQVERVPAAWVAAHPPP